MMTWWQLLLVFIAWLAMMAAVLFPLLTWENRQ